jgi:hypothetical protein
MKKVYLIKAESSIYKIGTSKHPEKRIRQLQTGNQEKLELINTFESKYATLLESTLHQKYAHLKENGEWYGLSLEDEVKFIENCEKTEANFVVLKENNNLFFKKY